jgi:hypothetical protein
LTDSFLFKRLSEQVWTPDEPAQEKPVPAPLDWALATRLMDELPFTLAGYRPLEQIYADDSQHIVVIKPAQVGVSEFAITRTCWTLLHGARYWQTGQAGLNVAYVFPTESALSDFSKERLSGLQWTPGTPPLFTDYDDVTFKQAGQSYLYLRSARSVDGLLSFRADVLILDEFDRMDPKARALAKKRLRASLVKREIDISTPTIPGRGIHAEYLRSDQHVWEVACSCGAWCELDFFRDVRADGDVWDAWKLWTEQQLRDALFTVHCPTCAAELDRTGDGRWTARRPDVTGLRGYHIPALSFETVSLVDLAIAATSDDPTVVTEFYRSDLGLPYEPAGSRITDDMLKQLSHELDGGVLPAGPWRNTTMGVDVGSRYHYRIDSTGPDGVRYVRAMGSVASWEALDVLLAQYKVRLCVVDAFPEQHGARDWAAKHSGKVLRALYPNGMAGELFRKDEDKGEIKINRTMAMDAVYTAVATATERWPAVIHNDAEVAAHMKAPIRVSVVDKHGQERADYAHTSPDHYYHASVYAKVAFEALPKAGLAGIGVVQGSVKGGWGGVR